MKIENIEEIGNKLLGRKEVIVRITFEGKTPSRDEIKKKICEKVGANPDLSILNGIRTQFGATKLKAVVNVYEDEAVMRTTEPKYLIKRNKLVKVEKKEEIKSEEPKSEEKKEVKEGKPEEKAATPKENPA